MGAMAGIALVASCQGNPNVKALMPSDLMAPKQRYTVLQAATKLQTEFSAQMTERVEKVASEQAENLEQGLIDIHGYTYQLSETEFNLLKMVTYAESGGSSAEEQMATAETILNRVAAKGISLTQVVFERGQFACARNGEIYTGMGDSLRLMTLDRVPETTSQAVEHAVYGNDDVTEVLLTAEAIRLGKDPEVYAKGGALYFCELSGCSEKEQASRANIAVKVKIGDHIYYKVWDE